MCLYIIWRPAVFCNFYNTYTYILYSAILYYTSLYFCYIIHHSTLLLCPLYCMPLSSYYTKLLCYKWYRKAALNNHPLVKRGLIWPTHCTPCIKHHPKHPQLKLPLPLPSAPLPRKPDCDVEQLFSTYRGSAHLSSKLCVFVMSVKGVSVSGCVSVYDCMSVCLGLGQCMYGWLCRLLL